MHVNFQFERRDLFAAAVGFFLAVALSFLLVSRYEVVKTSGSTTYQLDRWTGSVRYCVPVFSDEISEGGVITQRSELQAVHCIAESQ